MLAPSVPGVPGRVRSPCGYELPIRLDNSESFREVGHHAADVVAIPVASLIRLQLVQDTNLIRTKSKEVSLRHKRVELLSGFTQRHPVKGRINGHQRSADSLGCRHDRGIHRSLD